MDRKYKVEMVITIDDEFVELNENHTVDDTVLETLNEAPFQVDTITVIQNGSEKRIMSAKEYLNNLSDKQIMAACKDSTKWKTSGILPEGELCNFIKWGGCTYDPRDLEKFVLKECLDRFGKIVPILLKEYPDQFIK